MVKQINKKRKAPYSEACSVDPIKLPLGPLRAGAPLHISAKVRPP